MLISQSCIDRMYVLYKAFIAFYFVVAFKSLQRVNYSEDMEIFVVIKTHNKMAKLAKQKWNILTNFVTIVLNFLLINLF